MGRHSNRITPWDLEQTLKAFARSLGLEWYHYTQKMGYQIRPEYLPPAKKEEDDTRDILLALIEHLGLEYNHNKIVIQKKKGKR